MRINRFLPLITPGLSFILTEVFFFKPKMIYFSAALIGLLILFTVRQFTVVSKKDEKWWEYAILPFLFTGNLIVFSTLMSNSFLTQVLFVINLVFSYLYFRSIYYYLMEHSKYKENSMQNFSSYANFLSVYFLASAMYGLQAFLNAPVWLLMVIILLEICLIVYQVFWANKIDLRMGFFYIIISGLVLLELAWAISFLTLSYYILGLILVVCYYILIGLVRFYLLGTLSGTQIKHYLIFGFSSILVVLLTARWL